MTTYFRGGVTECHAGGSVNLGGEGRKMFGNVGDGDEAGFIHHKAGHNTQTSFMNMEK
jgi:hypothetical protein